MNLQDTCQQVVSAHPAMVKNFKNNKIGILGYLLAEVIKELDGNNVNPKQVNDILTVILKG